MQMGEYQYYADPYDKRDAAKGIRVQKKAEGVSTQPFRPASGGCGGATFNRIEARICPCALPPASSKQRACWLHWLDLSAVADSPAVLQHAAHACRRPQDHLHGSCEAVCHISLAASICQAVGHKCVGVHKSCLTRLGPLT